jgi:hypothetical protein
MINEELNVERRAPNVEFRTVPPDNLPTGRQGGQTDHGHPLTPDSLGQ